MNHNKIAAKTADVKSITALLLNCLNVVLIFGLILVLLLVPRLVRRCMYTEKRCIGYHPFILVNQKKTLKALFVFQCCKRGSKRDYVGDKNI